MRTTDEDLTTLRHEADLSEESSIVRIRERGLILRRVLSDLSRLAAIEVARGGLTSLERSLAEQSACVGWSGYPSMCLRLDDALKAANEELGRVREMLQRGQSDLCDCGFCKEARAYLAEVEGRDDR